MVISLWIGVYLCSWKKLSLYCDISCHAMGRPKTLRKRDFYERYSLCVEIDLIVDMCSNLCFNIKWLRTGNNFFFSVFQFITFCGYSGKLGSSQTSTKRYFLVYLSVILFLLEWCHYTSDGSHKIWNMIIYHILKILFLLSFDE